MTTSQPQRHAPADKKRRSGVWLLAASLSSMVATSHAQAPYAEGPLLDIVEAMPEGSWAKVNTNSFSDAWTPSALRPLYGTASNPTPSKIISSWSSFAWDSKRGDIILYGGGHANYSGNDVYRWRSRTLQWERAALPSQTLFVGSNTWTAIDGADGAPTSAHTYDNAVYLPLVDRYLNFGGAIYNTGGPYTRPSEADPTVLRRTGPYLFDPSRADPDKVGGSTGSHVQRVAPYASVVGGEMWENRDIHKHLAGSTLPRSHVNGCTAYSNAPESHDVVYVGARTGGGTALDLYRYQITDLAAPWLDEINRIGIYWSSPSAQTTCAHDPVANIVLRTGTNASPFFFWDLGTPGSSNREQRVSVTGSVKDMADWLTFIGRTIPYCALDYDQERANFLLWCGSGELWRVIPPVAPSIYGWEVIPEPSPIGTVPPNIVGTGILGKWEYVPGFDVFVGLENSTQGNIWVYKPVGWVAPSNGGDPGDGGGDPGDGGGGDPPAENVAPVVSLTTPVAGLVATVGDTITLSANASDDDGSISLVRFKVDGNIVGVSNVAPYSASWTASAAGTYVLTAEADDNLGAGSVSAAVTITVQAAPPPGGGASSSTVLRRALSGYSGVTDTYLSSYHKTSNFGSSSRMDFDKSYYAPLLRFAVFASEGGPVPDGAVIESAKLRVYKGNYDNVIALHALLVPWVESEATWNRPRAGATWSAPGARGVGSDYAAVADATVSAPWAAGWIEFDVADRLNGIAAGSSNNGWRLVSVSGNGNRKEFRSSEYASDPAFRPTLELTWSTQNGEPGGVEPGDGEPGGPGEEPPAENLAPVVSLTSPGNGTLLTVGDSLTLTADASDPDGSIGQIVFRANGVVVATAVTAPYSAAWIADAVGPYTFSAEAIDDEGASTSSAAVTVTVQAAPLPDDGTEKLTILQRSNSGNAVIADTYLSNYHKTSNFGSSTRMDFDRSNYVPLIKFLVFESEGGPIPDNAVIESASLHLYKGVYDNLIGLHAMLVPWVENQATWNRPSVGLSWSSPGAGSAGHDYAAFADAQANAAWSAGWVTFDVTERVRSFSSGTQNNGWRLVQVAGNSNRKEIRSSEFTSNSDQRPKLEITWRLPD